MSHTLAEPSTNQQIKLIKKHFEWTLKSADFVHIDDMSLTLSSLSHSCVSPSLSPSIYLTDITGIPVMVTFWTRNPQLLRFVLPSLYCSLHSNWFHLCLPQFNKPLQSSHFVRLSTCSSLSEATFRGSFQRAVHPISRLVWLLKGLKAYTVKCLEITCVIWHYINTLNSVCFSFIPSFVYSVSVESFGWPHMTFNFYSIFCFNMCSPSICRQMVIFLTITL